MADKIRYGVLGAGGHAKLVNRLLGETGEAQLVAACDPDAKRAAAMAEPAGAAAYADFGEMLARQAMEALVVCVPPFAHNGQEVLAAEKGIHLYIAKPIALDNAYAGKVLAAIDRAGVVSCVTYGMRYGPGVQKARELLAGRPVVLAEGHTCLNVRPGGGRPWMARKELSLGQMFTQACHVYDIFRYLVGEVVRVSTVKAEGFIPRSEAYDIEDAGVAMLAFASGAVGQVSCTVMAPSARSGEVGFRITAADLSLSYVNRDGVLRVTEGNRQWDYEQVSRSNDSEGEMIRRFLKAIRTGDSSDILTPYREAVRSLRIGVAVAESLKTGRPVEVSGA